MALDFPNTPTNGQLYTSNNVTWEYNSSTSTWDLKQDAAIGTTRVAILRDQKNYDIGGGYFYGDYWRDRDLTVKEDPSNFVTFVPTTNGQTTASTGTTPGYWSLPAGTYEIQWGAGGFDVNRHQTRLVWSTTQSDMTWTTVEPTYSTTTADNPPDETSRFVNNECFGSSENVTITTVSAWTGTWSKGTKVITITETTWFKVLHISDSDDPEGFGTEVDGSSFSPDRYTTGKNIYAEVRITDLATAVKDNATYVEGKTKVARLYDAKTSSTGGGTPPDTAYQNRTLNTKDDPNNFVTLDSGNVYFSLAAGSYKINWRAPAQDGLQVRSKLVYANNSSFTSSSEVLGESGVSDTASTESNYYTCGTAILTTTETTYFKIQQAQAAGNWGNPCGVGGDEIYTQVFVEDLSTAVKDNATYVEGTSRVALLKDEKDEGVQGGSFTTSGGWKDRNLTVEEDPQNLVNFTAGGPTSTLGTQDEPGYWSVPAGEYLIEWSAPAHNVNQHQTLLVYSTTESHISTAGLDSSASYVEGSSEDNNNDKSIQTISVGSKVITTTATTWFKIMHRCATDAFGEGMGQDTPGWGSKEIYTQVRITDLATAVKNDGTTSIVKQIKHASGPSAQTSYNSGTWTTIVQESITLTTSNNVLIDVKAGFYGGSEDTAYNGGRLLRTTSSVDTSLWEYSSIWGRVNSGSGFKASIDGPTVVDTPGTGTHTYQWQTYQHDASGTNDVLVPANGNSITLTEYT